MTVYICLFASQVILWFISRKSKHSYLWLSLSFLLLFFVSSFRSFEMGTDYSEYVPIYNHVANGNDYGMERGYILLNWLMSRVFSHYCGLAIGVNLMLMLPLFFYIVKNVSPKYWNLCAFIFVANPYMFIQSTFNILRQSCAIGMILIATHFFIRKKWFRGLIFVLLATFFHNIAIISILIPIFLFFKFKNNHWYCIIGISYILSVLVGNRLITFFAGLLNFEGYSTYEASVLNNPIYSTFIFVCAFFLVYYRDKYVETDIQRRFYDLYLLSLCMLFFAIKNDMVYRTYLIFAFVTLPAVPIVWQKSNNVVRLVYVAYYTVFYFGYILVLFLSKNSFYIPFRFCF